MIDSVLKGTGNSRFLKSAVPAGTSWADALAMLQAGTFPIDFNGINTEGFQQVGTPLNKANLLKDATAAQIGLPPSTTPDGMFQALGNTGELHVWRKTVTTSQEIPAGYKLGDVKTKKDISATGSGEGYIGFYMGYSDNLAVDDNGGISLNPDNDYGEVTANSNFTYISSVIAGKFILIRSYQRPDDNSYSSLAGKIFYVPADANISMTREYNYLYIRLSKCQDVTAYPLTPAGTTTTYPVSTNPNAYQEGDDAKEAGYTLGEVMTGEFRMSNQAATVVSVYVGSALTVNTDGVVSIASPSSYGMVNSSSGLSQAKLMKGKYIQYQTSDGDFNAGDVWFIPSDATIDWMNTCVSTNKRQPVTGYAAIPAGTTIEYLGKLGDKARVQVVSYVGTGTYGKNNPCSISVNFPIKVILFISLRHLVNNSNDVISSYFTTNNYTYDVTSMWLEQVSTDYKQYTGIGREGNYGKKSNNGRTYYWYSTSDAYVQGNNKGNTYTFLVIG